MEVLQGELVLIMDITGGTGAVGGLQVEMMAQCRGPCWCTGRPGGDLGLRTSQRTQHLWVCLALQARAETPPHPLISPPLPPPRMKCAETGGAARGKTPWRACTKGVLFKFV